MIESEGFICVFYVFSNLSKFNEILKYLCLNPKDSTSSLRNFTLTPLDSTSSIRNFTLSPLGESTTIY